MTLFPDFRFRRAHGVTKAQLAEARRLWKLAFEAWREPERLLRKPYVEQRVKDCWPELTQEQVRDLVNYTEI